MRGGSADVASNHTNSSSPVLVLVLVLVRVLGWAPTDQAMSLYNHEPLD